MWTGWGEEMGRSSRRNVDQGCGLSFESTLPQRETAMNHKKLALLLLGAITVFALFNLVVWKLGTELLLTKKYDGGDLARGSYIVASKYFRKNRIELPRKHFLVDFTDRRRIRADVLTIGDSFSMGLGEGKNHFYQDYIASVYNAAVGNVYPYPFPDAVMVFSPLKNLILFYNSGLLDEIGPKYVLLQSVERYCVKRFSRPYDFGLTADREKIVNYYRGREYTFDNVPHVSFINTGNVKFLYYNMLYSFSDRANKNIIYRKLTRPVFSRNGDHILFLNEDLEGCNLATDESMRLLNDNLNEMARLLEKKNIKLLFMPIVDKYDLYADYIADNPYPRSTFFEKLRQLPRRYRLIDTKQLLKEEVDKGVQDVFYPDESHWSWKAPEKIFSSLELQ